MSGELARLRIAMHAYGVSWGFMVWSDNPVVLGMSPLLLFAAVLHWSCLRHNEKARTE